MPVPAVAPLMIACLFAGVGAWAAEVSVTNNDTIYASELFGDNHPSPAYPEEKTPMVVLTIPGNLNAFDAVVGPPAIAEMPARDHNGSAEITFTLSGGAVFDANVSGLMYNADDGDDDPTDATTLPIAAPAAVASIVSGGRKGDSSITIKIEEADSTAATRPDASVDRAADGTVPAASVDHAISFALPRLADLGALSGANALDMNDKNDQPKITVSAGSRIVSGAFSDGSLTGLTPPTVISSRDAVTLEISDKNEKSIVIDGDNAFMSIKDLASNGYVELATITIETKQIETASKKATERMLVGEVQATPGTDDSDADADVYLPGAPKEDAVTYTIYDLDGDEIDEGLRGVLMVHVMGTELFNDGDMVFIDYDKNMKMGSGEGIKVEEYAGMSNALSVDPEKSDSFTEAGTGEFKVYYMPGGKDQLHHDTMINVTAMVHYSDPSADNEDDAKTSTTLKYDGVGNPVKVYAIPHDGNTRGDIANVRVRCEVSAGCRVFFECWDDMGNRGFDEAPMVAGNSVKRWTAADIEGVIGMEAESRLSCEVLSKGAVTVQQLTRSDGVLVNNTFVGGG